MEDWAVYFVRVNHDVVLGGEVNDLLKERFWKNCSRGVVGVVDDYHFRVWLDEGFQVFDFRDPVIFGFRVPEINFGSQLFGNFVQRLICGESVKELTMLFANLTRRIMADNVVSGPDQSICTQVVGLYRTRGAENVLCRKNVPFRRV